MKLNKLKHPVTYILIGLGVMLLIILLYMGVFQSIEIKTEKQPAMLLVCQPHTGPYSETMRSFDQLSAAIANTALNDANRAGIYYDNPDKVPAIRLRSAACVIAASAEQRAAMDQLVTAKSSPLALERLELPGQKYYTTSFPLRNDFSILLGVLRVYPAFQEFMRSHNHPEYTYRERDFQNTFVMEIYQAGVIRYLMTIPAEEAVEIESNAADGDIDPTRDQPETTEGTD
ncbi:MAG: hypothetical protein KDK39_02195 [Leptospiraceae bacterium]|nr:hypothetical protein [Leptospiraceae bacterium]